MTLKPSHRTSKKFHIKLAGCKCRDVYCDPYVTI